MSNLEIIKRYYQDRRHIKDLLRDDNHNFS
jgi:hypothetical protein